MKADAGCVCAGDAPPGSYSTSTPFMLLPGTFGRARSNTTVTFAAFGSAAEAVLIASAARTAADTSRVNMGNLLLKNVCRATTGARPSIQAATSVRGLRAEPLVEADRAQARALSRRERAVVEDGTEVARVHVRHDLARVLGCPEKTPDDFIHGQSLGTGDFDGAIERRSERDVGERRDHVVGRDRLEQRRRQADLLAGGGRL